MSGVVGRALFRALRREAADVARATGGDVLMAPTMHMWGSGSIAQPPVQSLVVASAFPGLRTAPEAMPLLPSGQVDLARLIRAEFDGATEAAEAEERGFAALRALAAQRELAACRSLAETRGVVVEAASAFDAQHSNGQDFVFCYRIRVYNNTDATIQVTGRHLLFFSGSGDRLHNEVPHGSPGVVGLKPVIAPGQMFEYGSGVQLDAATGACSGSLQVTDLDASVDFDAEIGRFEMVGTLAGAGEGEGGEEEWGVEIS